MRFRFASAILLFSVAFVFAPLAHAQIPVGPLIVSGYVQSDGLFSVSDDPFEGVESFRIRRARFSVRGDLTDRIAWESSVEMTASPVLRDAFVTFKLAPGAHLLAGQFVTPFSVERLTSTARLEGIDRALQDLVPSRDIGFGVQSGEPLVGGLTYGVALVNGLGQNALDDNDAKDIVARVAVPVPGVRGLSAGVNAATGEQTGGRRHRYGADAELKSGGLRLVGEFVREANETAADRSGLYVLAAHRWDAAEVVGRVVRLREDGETRRRIELGGNYYFAVRTRFMGFLFLEPDLPGNAVGIATRVQFAF